MDVRKPHDSCSRIRVGEGSPKTKENKQIGNLKNATLQKHTKMCWESYAQIIEKSSKTGY